MKLQKLSVAACLGATLLLSACGKDANGFGDVDLGTSGSTRGYGDVDVGMDKSVGLCSYLGGCMPEGATEGGPRIGPPRDNSGAHAPDHSVDSGTGDSN